MSEDVDALTQTLRDKVSHTAKQVELARWQSRVALEYLQEIERQHFDATVEMARHEVTFVLEGTSIPNEVSKNWIISSALLDRAATLHDESLRKQRSAISAYSSAVYEYLTEQRYKDELGR